MKLSRATISLYLGLVFASGAVLGVVGDRYYDTHFASKPIANNNRNNKGRQPRLTPEEWLERSLSYQKDRLKLSDDQVRQLRIIYDETRLAFEQLDRSMVPQRESIATKQTERINAMLSEAQRSEYDAMRKEREESMRKGKGNKRDRGFPGPGF